MRFVLDTNVVVSAFFWNGLPARLMESMLAADHTVATSLLLVDELLSTFEKPHLAAKIAETAYTRDQWLMRYQAMCVFFEPVPLPQPIAPDPDDDWVIATALAAQAGFIVTGDKPLLGVKRVGAVRIVGVAEALELLGVV